MRLHVRNPQGGAGLPSFTVSAWAVAPLGPWLQGSFKVCRVDSEMGRRQPAPHLKFKVYQLTAGKTRFLLKFSPCHLHSHDVSPSSQGH